jgi:EAL domain-containing protein (putative c-di-GMP-specific phosphodiesterase class I)
MADALGLETCAEGVEHDVAADVLDELGCDVAQGYRFARPVPARALPEVLATVAR